MAELFYGAPQRERVQKQLTARAELVSTVYKSPEQLQVINGATPWVLLRSSVNELSTEEADKLLNQPNKRSEICGVSSPAFDYVITGGRVRANDGAARAGIDLPNENKDNAAYRNSTGFGIVPMPGITSVDIKSRGKWGTIKEAEVRVEIHSLEDLEVFELLYFRPGYSAILEWGHSMYVDENGVTVNATPSTHTVSDDLFFVDDKAEAIQKRISEIREEAHYNYDGMFGFIRNFQWSYDAESQKYDALISIISKGVLYEGLQVIGSTENQQAEDQESDKETTSDYEKSPFHYCFYKLDEGRNALGLKEDRFGQASTKELLEAANANTYAQGLKDYPYFYLEKPNKDQVLKNSAFVPLAMVFDIVNNYNTIYSGKASKLPLVQFESEGQQFVTFDNHFSIDPGKAVPPKTPSSDVLKKFTVFSRTNRGGDYPGVPWIHNQMETWALNNGGIDRIGNIMVNVSYILDVFDDITEQTKESDMTLTNAIGNLLSGIQEALGGINDLAVYYNEEVNEWICLDVNRTEKRDYYELDISGLRSTVERFDVSSAITPSMTSTVAIAAQGAGSNYPENVEAMLRWNKHAIDRHFPYKDVNKDEEETKADAEKERIQRFREKFTNAWKDFNKAYKDASDRYDSTDFSSLRKDAQNVISKFFTVDVRKGGNPPPGVIPVSVNLEMLGLSGMYIATAFKIRPGILPSKYDAFGYLITGEEHSISPEGWTTTLSTNMFVLENYSDEVKDNRPQLDDTDDQEFREDEEVVDAFVSDETPQADRLRATLQELGYSEKGNELSNAGDITPQMRIATQRLFRAIKEEFPSVELRITGGNDIFHKNLPYSSKHSSGKGIDFIMQANNSNLNGLQARDKIWDIMQRRGIGLIMKNEYRDQTRKATGGHFHIAAL